MKTEMTVKEKKLSKLEASVAELGEMASALKEVSVLIWVFCALEPLLKDGLFKWEDFNWVGMLVGCAVYLVSWAVRKFARYLDKQKNQLPQSVD